MKKFLIQSIFLLLVIFSSLYYTFQRTASSVTLPPGLQQKSEPIRQTQVVLGDTKLNVEISDTAAKRSQGLGGRDLLAEDAGMLFLFDNANTYKFWMKGVKFPLDLIWIRGKTIVDITKNAPPADPTAPNEMIPVYQPKEPADKVLEVNAGFIDKNNIKVGDSIQIVTQ